MSTGTNEIDLYGDGNGDLSKERLEEQTVRAPIPPQLMDIIKRSGTNPHEGKQNPRPYGRGFRIVQTSFAPNLSFLDLRYIFVSLSH